MEVKLYIFMIYDKQNVMHCTCTNIIYTKICVSIKATKGFSSSSSFFFFLLLPAHASVDYFSMHTLQICMFVCVCVQFGVRVNCRILRHHCLCDILCFIMENINSFRDMKTYISCKYLFILLVLLFLFFRWFVVLCVFFFHPLIPQSLSD